MANIGLMGDSAIIRILSRIGMVRKSSWRNLRERVGNVRIWVRFVNNVDRKLECPKAINIQMITLINDLYKIFIIIINILLSDILSRLIKWLIFLKNIVRILTNNSSRQVNIDKNNCLSYIKKINFRLQISKLI